MLELVDHDKLGNLHLSSYFILDYIICLDSIPNKIISTEIYAIHAVPLKDKSVQLGLINVPIYDLPGEIEAPWINSENFPKIQNNEEVILAAMIKRSVEITEEPTNELNTTSDNDRPNETPTVPNESGDAAPPPGKKMKMVKSTRTFMQNGYQMSETVNELVPCDDTDVDMESNNALPAQQPVVVAAAPAKAKQSSMMSFFKKK